MADTREVRTAVTTAKTTERLAHLSERVEELIRNPPRDTETAIKLAELGNSVDSLQKDVNALVELMRKNEKAAQAQREQWIKDSTEIRQEIKALNKRLDQSAAPRPVADASSQPLAVMDAALRTEEARSRIDESRSRVDMWKAATALLGAATGALGTYIALT